MAGFWVQSMQVNFRNLLKLVFVIAIVGILASLVDPSELWRIFVQSLVAAVCHRSADSLGRFGIYGIEVEYPAIHLRCAGEQNGHNSGVPA